MKFHYGKWYFGIDSEKSGRFITFFNYLPKKYRYIGYNDGWYDGPQYDIGFYFFNISWSL